MNDCTRILLIDEDAEERKLTALVLRESVPSAEIVEVSSGLDYAIGLTLPELQFAISTPLFSWGEGPEVLSRVCRRHPHCVAIMLGDEEYERSLRSLDLPLSFEFYRKSSHGLAELARTIRRGSTGSPPAAVAPVHTQPQSSAHSYDHLRSELKHVHAIGESLVADGDLGSSPYQLVAGFWHAIARLQATVSFLLGESPGRDFERGPVNLAEIVLAAMRALQPSLTSASAKVLAGKLPVLIANRQRLLQLLSHLIDNAVKFRRVSHEPRVTIRSRKLPTHWELSVADNGMGIDPDLGVDAFVMFERSPAVTLLPGSGIGLAVCKQICTLYGGDVWCEINAQGGTTVVVELPVQEIAPNMISLRVQCNSRDVGKIEVMSDATKLQLTRAALTLPGLKMAMVGKTPIDVQLRENGVLNIVV